MEKKYIYVENGEINGCGEAETLTEGVQNIEVSDKVYNEFLEDELKYIFSNGKIIENPNYETDRQKFLAQKRIEEIKEELNELDTKRIRAVCESEMKTERTGESWLDYYNSQIYDLRIELKSLEAQL